MRVALVCPYAWDRFGGVQSQVRTLARALGERGHDVHVVAPRVARLDSAPGDDVVVAGRAVPVAANGSSAPIAFGPGAAVDVRRALRELNPDVVHVHEPLIPSISLFALTAAVAPAVGTFHAVRRSSVLYRAFAPALQPAARRLALRTAASEAALAFIARYFPGDYVLTPNAIDLERFEGARGHDERGANVVFVGRIEPRKGLAVLIRAVAELTDLGVNLVVAGTGSRERDARALAARLRVPTRWLGRVPDDALPDVYRSGAVFCHPATEGESFGIVLLEAMASGAAVVCSDLPGFRAAAGDAAEFVPPGDPRALAGALRALLTRPAQLELMRELGHARARLFDARTNAAEIEALYERAVSTG